jgi:predicted permease
MWPTLRHAWRALATRPALALTLVLTLALGVGANAAMLGALDALLLREPPHVRDGERVVRLYAREHHAAMGWHTGDRTSFPYFAALQARSRALAHVAAVSTSSGLSVTIGRGATAERARPQLVTASFWAVAGVRPALGRVHDAGDERVDAPLPGVVLADGYWRRRFGADPAVLGRTLEVGGTRVRVVGVAPRGFTGLDFAPVDLWLPLVPMTPKLMGPHVLGSAQSYWLQIVGRLRDGVPAARLAAEATVVYRQVQPDADARRATALVGPLQAARGPTGADDPVSRHVRWLALMSGALLLAAVATAAGLLLTRAYERRRELAVRHALGATTGHVLRAVLAEGALLGVACSAVATAVAAGLGAAVRRLVLADGFAALPALDGRLLLLTAACTIAAVALSVAITLRPALRAASARTFGAGAPRMTGRGTTAAGTRALRLVVATQVALTVVLLSMAGLFARSLGAALDTRIGYDASRALLVELDFPADAGWSTARRAAAHAALAERAAALPGVAVAALTDAPPLRMAMGGYLRVPGLAELPQLPGGGPYARRVTRDYFAATGTRWLAGGLPAGAGGRAIAVSALTARTLWPRGGAIGRCMVVGDSTAACLPVVGVVEDARRFSLDEPPALQYYVVDDVARADSTAEWSGVLLGGREGLPGGAAALAPRVRAALAALDPSLPPPRTTTLAEAFDANYAPWRTGATLLGAFSGIALVLCTVGLFGTVSYAAAQRTREVGIRLALGAQLRQVTALLVRGGLTPTAAGLAVGVAGAIAAGWSARALLYGTAPGDPLVLGAAAALMLATALVASWLPARRTRRVAPADVLRAD